MLLHLVAIICASLAFAVSVARLVASVRVGDKPNTRASFAGVYGCALLLGGSLLHGLNTDAADVLTIAGWVLVFYFVLLMRQAKGAGKTP